MKKMAKMVKNYLEIAFSMKNVLLILFTAFLVAAPLLVGQEDDIRLPFKAQLLKYKISQQFSKNIIAFQYEIFIKMYSLDTCCQLNLFDENVKLCSEIKNQLLAINDQYIPSEDELLKRRLENPTDLDILDFTLKFSPNERVAVNHMAQLIDKNIERSEALIQLQQEDFSLKNNVIEDFPKIENGWYTWFSINTPDANQYSNNINRCRYHQINDKETMDQCLKVKEFIKKHTSKLNSDDKQRIAQLMINLIDANMAYNEEKIPYNNALNNLYTQARLNFSVFFHKLILGLSTILCKYVSAK